VERVARAICQASLVADGYGGSTGDARRELEVRVEVGWSGCAGLARAAIQAMREPTEAISSAGPPRLTEALTYRDMNDLWRAKIDAALTPASTARKR